MERCLSGLKGHPAKVLDLNGSRGFKSLPLRHFGYVKVSASPLRGSAAKLNGELKEKINFWFCKMWFEPIFLRNVAISEGFSADSNFAA